MGQQVAAVVTRWEVAADGALRLLIQTVPLALEAEWWRVRTNDSWAWRRPPLPGAATTPTLNAAASAALSKLAEKPADPTTASLLDQLVIEHPVLVRIADQFGLAVPRR